MMIKLKFISLLFLSLLFLDSSFSQIDFSTHQYFYTFPLNPAMAGMDDKAVISFYRKNISSKNTILSGEFPSKILNSNIGIIINRNYNSSVSFVGKTTKNRLGLAYNYNFDFSDFARLRLGFQFTHIAATYDNFSTNIDAHWFTANDFNLGAVIISHNFKFGVGILNILNPTIDGKSSMHPLIDEKRNAVFTFSYNTILNQKFELIPAMLINIENKKVLVSDFSLYLNFRKKLFLGTTFRHGKNQRNKTIRNLIGLLGIHFKEKLIFQISINPKNESNSYVQFLTQYKF
ncbi:MAG: type IX secretion system membrane protein PorP/SprF [Saprospiraceae bacterium]